MVQMCGSGLSPGDLALRSTAGAGHLYTLDPDGRSPEVQTPSLSLHHGPSAPIWLLSRILLWLAHSLLSLQIRLSTDMLLSPDLGRVV